MSSTSIDIDPGDMVYDHECGEYIDMGDLRLIELEDLVQQYSSMNDTHTLKRVEDYIETHYSALVNQEHQIMMRNGRYVPR